MVTEYNIKFVDERFGQRYGITFAVKSGRIENVEIVRNPDDGCASRIGKIRDNDVMISRLVKKVNKE